LKPQYLYNLNPVENTNKINQSGNSELKAKLTCWPLWAGFQCTLWGIRYKKCTKSTDQPSTVW